jgi:hypothetical protein
MSAASKMAALNRDALHGRDRGKEIFIEDVRDPDGRWYRIEYQCESDGSNAVAFCRSNPWGRNPYSYTQSHLGSDGFICYADPLVRDRSGYDLDYVVKRVRTWCVGYSFMREHGFRATCAQMPEWGG